MKKQKVRIGSKEASIIPLIPLKKNKLRRTNPVELGKQITEFVENINGIRFDRITDVKGTKRPSLLTLMNTTAYRELVNHGYDDEEMRVIKGMRPRLTSGKSYYDRFNACAINKMGAMAERWIVGLPQNIGIDNYASLLLKSGYIECVSNEPQCCTQIILDIDLSQLDPTSIPEEGLILEVRAKYGCSGKFEYLSKEY